MPPKQRSIKWILLIVLAAGLVQVLLSRNTLVRAEAVLDSHAVASPGAEWAYWRAITINNPGSALSDFQVKVSLSAANFTFAHAQSVGQDLRVLDSDDVTPLSYWLENYNASAQSATLWVKVPSLPANTSKTIYLYYGNPIAPAATNGN